MITFLGSINSFITSDTDVVNLIAGSSHLEEDPDEVEKNKNYSLKAFYNFIETRKNIVILRPKIL